MDTTIIYCTDNSLSHPISGMCIRQLKKSVGDRPIVSVSHKPIDLGKNICIGEHKRCWLTLYKQLLIGVQNATTEWVHIAEHDCLYTDEHFSFIPKDGTAFWYNENVLLLQWSTKNHPELKGMFSRYWTKRLALSQLVCKRDLLMASTEAKLNVLDQDNIRDILHAGEPGITRIRRAARWAKSGKPVYLKQYLQNQLEKETYRTFKTKTPNVDIRHDANFTGPKRGKRRCYEDQYWGRLEDMIGVIA